VAGPDKCGHQSVKWVPVPKVKLPVTLNQTYADPLTMESRFCYGREIPEGRSVMDPSKPLQSFLSGRVRILLGDITKQNVDVIVNAANSALFGGGGVDGAIHAKGGPQILEACREIRRTRYPHGLPTGEVVLTTGGNLPARYVIHTVGPITRIGHEPDALLLASCYRNSLALASENGLRSIAFPAISTGAFGYPPEQAAPVVSETIDYALTAGTLVEQVRLVFYEAEDARLFLKNQRFTTH
jgi:O-acetyl-ADP-ribose deacetylase (regulator of RNase III)